MKIFQSEFLFFIFLALIGFFVLLFLLTKRAEYMKVESDKSLDGFLQKRKFVSLFFLLFLVLLLIGIQINAFVTKTQGLTFSTFGQ